MLEVWLIVAVAIAALVVVFGALFINRRQTFSKGPIFVLAIVLVVLGITFSDDPLVGYSFLGTSMALSVIYAIKGSRKK